MEAPSYPSDGRAGKDGSCQAAVGDQGVDGKPAISVCEAFVVAFPDGPGPRPTNTEMA